MSNLLFYDWPNGMRSVAGGTRSEIKLSRPWQKEIEVNPETCPFCTGKGQVLETFENGRWQLLKNKFTPYPFHQMIIPSSCWPPEVIRTLGGADNVLTALTLIENQIVRFPGRKMFITVHIGALAGQNVGHLHYHLVQYAFDDDASFNVPVRMSEEFSQHSERVLFSEFGVLVGVGGLKAGQCFLLPREKSVNTSLMVDVLSDLIALYNKKFKSTQGLPPDFSLALQYIGSAFQYGVYTPVLNHWGAAEQMALYEAGCPITLPWPHEQTVEYLKS